MKKNNENTTYIKEIPIINLSGWGNYPQKKCRVIYAKNETDFLKALETQESLTVRGMGRSYGDQATNEKGLVIDITGYNRFLDFDEKKGVLHCQAGVTLEDIIKILGPRGFFPMITPGTKYVTIGGAIANDVHGKAHHVDGSFIECVEEMRMLLADGSIKSVSRKSLPDLFYATFGGLGLTGIILDAKIKLKKIKTTYFIQKAYNVNNLDELLDTIDQADHDFDYSVAWVDPLAKGKNIGRGVLTAGKEASIEDLPESLKKDPLYINRKTPISVPFFFPDFALNPLTVRILNKVIHFVQSSSKTTVHYEKFFYPLDAIHLWNRGYGKRGFIQYQFVLPLENGKENIRKIMEMISGSGMNPFLNVLKKFGSKKSGPLSFPMGGYTFAIDFPVSPGLKAFTEKLDRYVLECKGRLYAGKDAMLSADSFSKMYPALKEWKKVKKKYDPENRFSSDIGRRLGL
jgi:FAD/FMN-containing dehydrogenase